jgi:small subunit ribosomal protein S12e
MVDSGKEIGEWCGLAKFNEDGTARKIVRTSCAVITDYGEETPALNIVLKYVQSQQE